MSRPKHNLFPGRGWRHLTSAPVFMCARIAAGVDCPGLQSCPIALNNYMCKHTYMPNKTIYVSATDLPIFEQAAAMAGGLSPAIAAALRMYVSNRSAGRADMERQRTDDDLIELDVAEGPARVRTRFRGERIAKLSQTLGLRRITFEVYRTAKSQFALYIVDRPDWSRWSQDSSMWEDPQTWEPSFTQVQDRSLQVFETMDELLAALPGDLVNAARFAIEGPSVRVLDI